MITDCLTVQSSPGRALKRFCEPSSKRHGRKRNGSCAHPWTIRGWAGEDCPWTVASSEHCLIAVRGTYPRCPEAPKGLPLWGPLGTYPGGYPYHWSMAPYDDFVSFVGAFPQTKPDRENPKPERLAYLLGTKRGPYGLDEIGWALAALAPTDLVAMRFAFGEYDCSPIWIESPVWRVCLASVKAARRTTLNPFPVFLEDTTND